MAEITVESNETTDGWRFSVSVAEGGGETRHEVTLSRADYERLAAGGASPEDLVRESFAFLLERESKESVLRSFDLTVIGRYFPEYDAQIQKRLGG